jgi:IrrE N-terminal-like domain
MTNANPMKALYARLSAVGLTKAFVQKTALPSWWDDEAALSPSGYVQGLLLLSRHLGVELASLQDTGAAIRLRSFGACKFKKANDVSEDDLALARVLATRAAQLAAEATANPILPLPSNAGEIRQQILDGGAPWVGLSELIDFCWASGVPVLHFDHFPRNARRPHGFAAMVNGRPVVVLCKRARHSAWLLFILAHELGHIAMGHVAQDGVLIDDHIDEASVDVEEQQANAFAIALLTGSATKTFIAAGRWPNATDLAEAACRIGRQDMVDPGHIVLNYAHSMGPDFYAVGNAALKRLEPEANAFGNIREKMSERLDWSRLPEDSSEFLMRVTREETAA